MDSGRFLFNFEETDKDELFKIFREKVENFFKWYSNFHNQDPIAYVELFTNDTSCEDGCHIPIDYHVSVIDLLIDKKKLLLLLKEQAEKYRMTIEIKPEED
ncbi:hypothetical protein A9Q84_08990 [Halobacteriovorax marinus]|uniref:Uncharacterized protein n=1 Tax=Halobacteriovorax marinus TaxID=97084 RepID=A0A1Y5F6Q3_9BACT|nr:hypothetical protein A9Q84_08990 [Halobacteriovorax marinus]